MAYGVRGGNILHDINFKIIFITFSLPFNIYVNNKYENMYLLIYRILGMIILHENYLQRN